MKRKRLALLLAAALTVTSVDGTAFAVSGADFSSEPVEEAQTGEEISETAEDSGEAFAEDFSAEAEETESEQQETLQPEEETTGEADAAGENEELTAPEELSPEEGETLDDGAAASEQKADAEVSMFSDGEEDAIIAGEGESATSIIPDTLQDLTLDQDYDVNITGESKEAWFSFTPQEDGFYIFTSTSDECDPKAYAYDKNDVTDKDDYLKYDDDGKGSGSNRDFKLFVNMTQGTTYYFCAQLYNDDQSGNFTVRLEKQLSPSSVQINMDNVAQTEFMSDIDYNTYLPGMELTVDYGEGKEPETITFSGSSDSNTDQYGNTYRYAYQSSKSEDTDNYYYAGYTLSEGTWNVVILCNGSPIETNAVSFQVKTLENLPELHIGEDNTIESPAALRKWYTFTAPETAEYTISPVSDVSIYKQADKSDPSYERINDKCVVSLEKDQTYYVGFNGERYIDDNPVNQWDVSIKKKAEIASLGFSEKELVFTAIKEHIHQYTPVGTLTVNYINGNSADSVEVSVGGTHSDRYGNRITTKLTGSDGKEFDWEEEELPVGNYTLSYSVSVGDTVIKTADIPLTVQRATFDSFPKITLGENQIKTSNDNDDESAPCYYGFKVDKDGVYAFDRKTDYEDGWSSLKAYWYRFNDNGDMEKIDPENVPGGLALDKGEYLVYWFDYDYGSSATIIAKYVPAISSVKVKSWKAYDSTVIEKTGNASLKELVAEITCEDGKTKELKYNSKDNDKFPTDEYGRRLSYTLCSKDENGKYQEIEEEDNLKAGNYVYRVSVGDVFAEDIPFKVLSRDEAVNKELTTGTTELENQANLLLKYKAPADGRYELAVNIPVTQLEIRKSDETKSEYMDVTDYRVYTNFEKDETYYIYVRANEYCPELKVTVSALTRPESMETTALKKNYIAGIEYFEDRDVQTKISFDGKKSRTVRGRDVVEGYGLQYRVENSEGKEYDTNKPLTVGTWKVTPYLSASIQTGSSIAVEMLKLPVVSDTITAKKMDLNSLPKLSTDSWTEVANNMHNMKYYAFTAQEEGTYEAQSSDERGNGYALFYADGKDGYTSCDDKITLKKGETCLVGISTFSDMKFRVSKVTETPSVTPEPTETPEAPEAVTEIALTDGMKKDVSYTGKDIKCTFTPEEDGCYVLESSSWKGEDADPYAEIYDEDGEFYSNDDGGERNNFKLIWKLEKGKKYTYIVRAYDKPANFTLSFHKQDSVKIKDIELVPRSEEETFASEYRDTILAYVGDSCDLKFTYEDGTSEIQRVWDSSDKYGGSIRTNIETEDKPFGESVTFKVTVVYRFPWQTEEESFKKELTIKKKGLATFEQMEMGKDYPTNIEGGYYCFTPSEDGKYIITSKDEKGVSCYINTEMIGEDFSSNGYLDSTGVAGEVEGESASAVTLKAGKTYLIFAECRYGDNGSIRIQKVKKTLKGLELIKAPEQTTCLPNDTNYVSLRGLQLKALYTDGTTEMITYGEADSSGRQIYRSDIKWMADGSCTVYVNLENYQVGFDLKEASWDDVQEMKVGKKLTLNAELDDVLTLKFVPEYDGIYWLNVINGYVGKNIIGANAEDDCNYRDACRLTAGKTYYFHIYAADKNPEVTIKYNCTEHKWDGGKVTKEATCKEEGVKTYTCSVCGTTRTESIAKTTDHKWDAGKVTKEATCTTDGEKLYTCDVCGETRTEVIAKTGHKFGAWVKVSDATIKAKQKQERTCSVCKTTEEREVGNKLKPSIKLNVSSITLQEKQSTKVVKVTMQKGDSVKSWSSNNKKVATVEKNGQIKAKKKGTAKITVILESGKQATVTVKVQEKKVTTSKITGLKSSVSIVRGKTVTLKPVLNPITSQDKITYSTSDKKVATVNSKGVITGKKVGTAKITVKSGSKKVVVTVKVTPKVKTTKLSGVPKTKNVSKGKSFTIKAVATPKNTEEKITYKSSNSKVATVTAKGVVKGIKKGTATITVQSGSKKQTCKVTVK